jgi:hypothetical protein
MRKVFISGAVIFLMIFTAGLATATEPASIFPFTTTTGTLYFISNAGTVTSDATTATITLKEATVTTGEPTNLFWGTLAFTPASGGALLTFDIAATRGEEGVFHITGATADATATLTAQGKIECVRHFNKSTKTKSETYSIALGGSILDGTTFAGRFEGVLSEPK